MTNPSTSEDIILLAVQSKEYNGFEQPCATACPTDLWTYGHSSGCDGSWSGSKNAYCSYPNPASCPVIGIDPVKVVFSANKNGGPGACGDSGTPTCQIECTYPTLEITTISDITAVLNSKGIDGEQLNVNSSEIQTLLSDFCGSQTTTGCPTDIISGVQMPVCSNFVSTATDSNGTTSLKLCSEWASSNKGDADAAKTQYCSLNPQNLDCACLQPNQDPNFKILSDAIQEPAPCWFTPCQIDNTGYLQTSAIVKEQGECPARICDDINTNIAENGGSINVKQFQSSIKCNIDGKNSGGGGKSNGNNSGSNTNNNTGKSTVEQFFEDNWKIIVGILVITFVLILVALLIRT